MRRTTRRPSTVNDPNPATMNQRTQHVGFDPFDIGRVASGCMHINYLRDELSQKVLSEYRQ